MSCNRYHASTWAETQSLRLDDDGTLWLRLVQIDDEDDDFLRLGPIEWGHAVLPILRGQLAYLEDLWRDASRDNPRAERHRDYLLAISG